MDSNIQTCHGFRKYFENALDDANVDHEKKMVIEGHFAGTRARHYTERDVDDLRQVYSKAYPFIILTPENCAKFRENPETLQKRLTMVEAKLARQTLLEAKLMVLEDELEHLKSSRMTEGP